MDAHLHPAGVAVPDLDMSIDDHGVADEPHGSHADGIACLRQLELQRRDLRIRVSVTDRPQAGRTLSEHHARVLRPAEPHADDGRLAGEPPLAESHQGIEEEPLDALNPVAWKQHAVVGAEQPSLVHGDQVDPLAVRLMRVLDLRSVDPDIVVVVRAPQGVDAIP